MKTARLEARITEEQKSLIERAAAHRGTSVSDFVVQTMSTAAQSVIEEQEILRATAAQSRVFAESLIHPPRPNRALRKAADEYRRRVRSE